MRFFWFYMTLCAVLLPAIMVVFGVYFRDHVPKRINAIFGYRTTRAMQNHHTWKFAHQYCGRLWFSMGRVLFVASLVWMLFLYGKEAYFVGWSNLILMGIQILAIVYSLFRVEKALKDTFDEHGKRKRKE